MTWQTTYPTVAAVMLADFNTLWTWHRYLPAPQTDVERTVWRRVKARCDELAGQELRKTRPDLADKFNDIVEKMAALGIKSPVGRI